MVIQPANIGLGIISKQSFNETLLAINVSKTFSITPVHEDRIAFDMQCLTNVSAWQNHPMMTLGAADGDGMIDEVTINRHASGGDIDVNFNVYEIANAKFIENFSNVHGDINNEIALSQTVDKDKCIILNGGWYYTGGGGSGVPASGAYVSDNDTLKNNFSDSSAYKFSCSMIELS